MPLIDANDTYQLTNVGAHVDATDVYNSHRNLVHNPFFTINQRGAASYSGNVYGVDRWRGANARTSVAANTGYVTISTNSSGNGIFRQFLPDNYSGILTYSAYVRGTGAGLFTMLDSNLSTLDEVVIDNPGNDWVLISGTYEDDTPIAAVQFRVNTSTSYDIKCVKLELGPFSTLPNDVPPNYALELLKCQRYFHLYGTSAARPSNRFDCVPHMASTPTQGTVSIGGTTYYYNAAEL